MGPVVDCTPLKIGRGVQPNFRQSEPKGEVPDLYGKRICSCPNCPPPLQGPGDRKLPESAGYTAGGDKGVACEEVREGESAGSLGVRWAPGVSANGDAWRGRARPRHCDNLRGVRDNTRL